MDLCILTSEGKSTKSRSTSSRSCVSAKTKFY